MHKHAFTQGSSFFGFAIHKLFHFYFIHAFPFHPSCISSSFFLFHWIAWSLLNFCCSFIELCWCCHFFLVVLPFWCYCFVFVGVFTPLLLLHIFLVAQNHIKPRLLLFWNSMKLPPSIDTIFSFATSKEAEAKKRQKGQTNVKIGYSLSLATIVIIIHLVFAWNCWCTSAKTTCACNTMLSRCIIATYSLVAFLVVISFAPSFSYSSSSWFVASVCCYYCNLQVIVGVVASVCFAIVGDYWCCCRCVLLWF